MQTDVRISFCDFPPSGAIETRVRERVAKLEAANPRIRVAEVDAGHNVAGDNPQGFVAALAPFLATLQETGHAHARN